VAAEEARNRERPLQLATLPGSGSRRYPRGAGTSRDVRLPRRASSIQSFASAGRMAQTVGKPPEGVRRARSNTQSPCPPGRSLLMISVTRRVIVDLAPDTSYGTFSVPKFSGKEEW
jgi:hypothetical protein